MLFIDDFLPVPQIILEQGIHVNPLTIKVKNPKSPINPKSPLGPKGPLGPKSQLGPKSPKSFLRHIHLNKSSVKIGNLVFSSQPMHLESRFI